MESIRQEKYPQPSKKEKKIDCYGYVRTEDRKNTHSQAKKIIEKRKQIKKKTRHIVILTYNMARFQLHIPQLS